MSQNKTKASTQAHLDVEDITENLVLLKSGSAAMILTTTAVNFDILSEAEQDATIYAYAAFLNSLSFPVQVLIRSKKADITAYYQHLEASAQSQPNPDLKRQIEKYMEFIQSTVQQKTILDKKFYFIITFSPLELGLRGIKKQSASKYKNKPDLIRNAQVSLLPKKDHIIKQAARLGLLTTQLSTKELIELFYDIYNPAPTGTQKVVLDTDALAAPLVKPAIESPQQAPQANTKEPVQISQQVNMPTQPVEPQPQVISSTAQQATPPSLSQQEALNNLQSSTAKAASFVAQRQASYNQNFQPSQPTSPTLPQSGFVPPDQAGQIQAQSQPVVAEQLKQ